MTMLDRMRRHKGWLKWSLALVCLTFVFFYIPDFLDSSDTSAPGAALATVDGRTITATDFQRVYNAQLQAYRNAYGANMNDRLLRQLGIDRQILQQLVDEQAALAEAARLGLTASDAEVRERILRIPAFQENGQFVGEERYKQFLRFQNPPMTHTEFEESVRQSLVLDKLRAAITDWITVSDDEVEREYRYRNEKVKVQLVAFTADRFRDGVEATDAEVAAHFEANAEAFRIGERRKIRFISVDAQTLGERVAVAPQDVERFYNINIDQYSSPEEVRASHILFTLEGKNEDEVRAKAEAVLAEARGGADFAALARTHSEDSASQERGGDLDSFGRGRMVPEFEEVAFSLEPGAVSDLVRSPFGFHIIKVFDKKEAVLRPLDEVRDQIAEQLKVERAQQQADDMALRFSSEIRRPADLDRAAAANGLQVQESEFFLRDEPIAGIGFAPEVTAEAFSLPEGGVSQPVPTPQGFAVLAVVAREESRVPALDEVKDRVRDALLREKALAAARAAAAEAATRLVTATDFEAAAKSAGLEPRSTDLVARGTAWPDVGIDAAIDAAVFELAAATTSAPIRTATGAVIVRVVEREDVTPEQVAEGVKTLRDELVGERRNRFFSSYMVKAKQRMKIEINREVLQRVTA